MRLHTLGVFRLLVAHGRDGWLDFTDTRSWGHGRAQDLLLLLLLRRRPLARIEAAATLWPEAETSHRARLLRNALWNLRQALEHQATVRLANGHNPTTRLTLYETPTTLHLRAMTADSAYATLQNALLHHDVGRAVRTDTNVIEVDAGDQQDQSGAYSNEVIGHIWCDALAFDAANQQARAAQSTEERLQLGESALQFYVGPFLPHRQDVAWITAYRARLHARWAQLTLDLATNWRRAGQREHALELLLNVLDQDLEQLAAARLAMLLLGEIGRVREALDLYERIRRSYRTLFGADPIELKRLAADLRAGNVLRADSRQGSEAKFHFGVNPESRTREASQLSRKPAVD